MKINKILDGFSEPPLELLAETLDLEVLPLQVEMVNWEDFAYKPDVSVQIAWNDEELFLQYKVTEQSVMAITSESNGPVWTDSCVEFFLSPEGNDDYYNLEMNCIGTVLLGFRKKGEKPVHAEAALIERIRRVSSLGSSPFQEKLGEMSLQITAAIPWNVFFSHRIDFVSGTKMRGNFYKCGDHLSVPHFVSWTKIGTDKPNFHCPEFFGGLEFVD